MFKNLTPGAIGLRVSADEAFTLAKSAGFEGIDVNLSDPVDVVRERYEASGLRVGCLGLPLNFRGSDADYAAGMDRLPDIAARASAVGCSRCATWLTPASDELTYTENFQLHVERLRPAAQLLDKHGIRLGLEFVAPLTCRADRKHPFVHNLEQTLELCAAIGTPNMGLLLDAWHWYNSEGSVEDITALAAAQIVQVHVNDAPAGVPLAEQRDGVRDLPGATGVIDIGAFLNALAATGYDGPVTPEPFCQRLKELAPAQVVRETAEAMDRIFELLD